MPRGNGAWAWRYRTVRYRMAGETCPGCGGSIFPPRDICPFCHTNTITGEKLRGKRLMPPLPVRIRRGFWGLVIGWDYLKLRIRSRLGLRFL